MSDALAPEHFADWYEQMVQRYDPEIFYRHPNAAVRWVELKRVKAVIRLLDLRPHHAVLDAGCGAGNLLEHLTGGELHGADLSKALVVRARKRLGDHAVIVQADTEHLPFPDAKFDRVVASSLLSHVLHPDKAVAELKRVTKPGGRIVISVADEAQIERGMNWAKKLGLARLILSKSQQAIYHVDYHLHRFSLQRLREVVGNRLNELQVVRVPAIYPVHWVVQYEREGSGSGVQGSGH